MILEVGYANVSITDLCARIEMPRKAFYRYFDNKETALLALVEHTLAEYDGFNNKVPPEHRSLLSELEEYFKFWYKNRTLLDVFTQNNIFSILLNASINYPVGDMISIAKFLPEDDAQTQRQIFRFAICGLTLMMVDWYERGFKESFADMAKYACRAISKPLFPNLESLGFQ